MKLLLIPLVALAACSTEPTNAQVSETPAAPSSETNLADQITASQSETAALKAKQDYLDEMAAEGIYPETQPTQITVKYHRSGLTIGLYNESYVSQTDYYQQKRSSAVYKVIPDIKMGALIKALDDLDFFAEAEAGIKRYVGASISIVFRRGNESFSMAWGPEVNAALREIATLSGDSVRLMYDTTRSIQIVENVDGADYFQKESDRINQQNAIRRSKPRQ